MSIFQLLLPLGLIWGGVVLILRGIVAFEQGKGDSAELDAVAAILKDVQDAHATMAARVDTLREEQDFAARLRQSTEPR